MTGGTDKFCLGRKYSKLCPNIFTMKKIALLGAAILTLSLLIGFEACQSSKTSTSTKLLKFNLEKGKGYDYEMTMNMDQEIMGQPIQMDMSTYYSMEVDADDGTTKTISTSIDRFKMKTAAAGFNLEVDTDNPVTSTLDSSGKDDPFKMVSKLFGAIKGKKFTMKVDAEGKISDITGFENMGQALVDSLDLPAEEKDKMRQQFDKQFNGDQVRSQLERFWYIFPNKEVKIGDTWNRTMDLNGDMPGKYNSTYKVTEIEGDIVTLDEKTKVDSEQEKMKLTGDITGTIVVDSKLGLVVSANQDMNMKAEASGMSFDIKGKIKIKGKAR